MSTPVSNSTPILALPTAAEIAQLDPATLAAMPAVAYDLKRLKVYSSCLRCRAKKVKCDRKEPCSRCEKHNVECSYRELASVQLDIRQFQRHLNNPKVRKDGAGIITSSATPIIVSSSTSTSSSTCSVAAGVSAAEKSLLVTVASERGGASSPLSSNVTSIPLSATSSTSEFDSDLPSTPRRAHNAKANPAMARAKVTKLQRKKKTTLSTSSSSENLVSPTVSESSRSHFGPSHQYHNQREPVSASTSSPNSDTEMEGHHDDEDDENNDVPIWRARPIGRHHQTPQEQELAETFGLAAYIKAKEESGDQAASGAAGQSIAYEMELERALALRMPSSFARSADRVKPYSRPSTNGPLTSSSRPSHCQYPPGHHTPSSWAAATEKTSLYHASFPATPIGEASPQATQCCCQIAARNGQAPGTCYYSTSHPSYEYGKYDYDYRYEAEQATAGTTASDATAAQAEGSVGSGSEQSVSYEDDGHTARIQYSPSYSPSYQQQLQQQQQQQHKQQQQLHDRQQSPSGSPHAEEGSYADRRVANFGHPIKQESPATPVRDRYYLPELPSIMPATAPSTSDLSAFQVGRDKSMKIACKYNEPNVDAWDMIEQPLALPRPSSFEHPAASQQGRSIKMEMGWILS
ncbi:hypothetical protein BGZ73_001136 [Actinomortierella ambigua]|nr:hypothetical protein BGZ73_001136 [Actinomortierella ambigua]